MQQQRHILGFHTNTMSPTTYRPSAMGGTKSTLTSTFRKFLAIVCLMMVSVGAWAADIVIYSPNNGYLSINTTGNGTVVGTFQGDRSLWETSGDLGTTSRNIRSKAYTTDHYLYSDSYTASTNITISNTNTSRWQYRNNFLCTRYLTTNYYLRYTNGTLSTANTQDNNCFGYYTYTINNVANSTEDFTISGTTIITSAGNYDFMHTNKVVTPAHTHYAISNGDNYYDLDGNITATNPRTESTTGYVWSLSGGGSYANINATSGRLIVTSMPSDDVEMTVTCTLNGAEQKSMKVTLSSATPAGYVIYNGSNYLNSSTAGTTSFDPRTCIWVGTSGSTFQNGAGYYLRRSNNNNGTFSVTRDNSAYCTLSGTESGTTGSKIRVGTNNNGWLRFSGNAWNTNTEANAGNVVFSVLKKTGAESSTAPTIIGDATIATLGNNSSYAHTEAAYTMGYNDYIFYDGAHHYWKSDDSQAIAGNIKPAAESFTYTWSLSGNADGHATVNASTGVITYSTYYDTDTDVTLTLTATSANKTFTVNKTIQFLSPKNDPTSVSATDMTLNVGEQKTIEPTLTPTPCYVRLEFSSANPSIATVNATTGEVTGVAGGQTTVTIKAYKYSNPSQYVSTTITVTVMDKVATPVIEFAPQGEGETASTTITCGTADAKIYYTTDGSTPTSSSTEYTGAFNVNNLVVVKAIAVKEGGYFTDSEVASATYSKHKMPTPTIDITNGQVSFSCSEDGASFYYTIDGSTPTTGSTLWNGTPFTPSADECTIKVIAVKAGSQNSDVAERPYVVQSGVSGSKVILNDYEDHTWTYYAGVDSEVDNGHYNTTYIASGTGTKRDVKMYSPDPRNVKITYKATQNAQVSISESENTFVYYNTLEQGQTAGQYPYTVISNPFSKRPSSGTGASKVYYGFAGWKVTSGYSYMRHANGTAVAKDEVLALDESIYFTDLPYPSVNCTSAEIEMETTWVAARVQRGGGNINNNAFQNGNYEINLLVINAQYTNGLTPNYPVTIMQVEPDGSADYRGNNFTSTITPVAGAANMTKVEWANWSPGAAINPQGRNFTIGRGIATTMSARDLYGTNTDTNIDQVLKVESGRYSGFTNYGTGITARRISKQWVTLGNDYDRAKSDNTKLNITGAMYVSNSSNVNAISGQEVCRVYGKSGQFCSSRSVNKAAAADSYYFGFSGRAEDEGYKYLEIQGGEWCNIAGGMGTSNIKTDACTTIRMKGGLVRGSIYGAAQFAGATGWRTLVFTGGTVKGWIAGGANGTQDTGGLLTGTAYVYIGGNTRVDASGTSNNTPINSAVGGNVFGAGCGYSADKSAGEVTDGTNVVVADKCYVQRGVYGGGAFGFTTATSYVYVTGGLVDGQKGGADVNPNGQSGTNSDNRPFYTDNIQGGVYGGSSMNNAGTINVYMTGGEIHTGLYGGSNLKGTIANDVTMRIDGGQVGISTAPANIHGGGFGQLTVVNGNVDITLGKDNAGLNADGVTVWGDVYGGSALGQVNATATVGTNALSNVQYKNNTATNVTMNAGYIHGSLYGGALGSSTVAANVYGPVAVTVNGGSVFNTDGTGANGSGAVYGANNINGAPQRAVTVDIYGTNKAPAEGQYALFSVYGGGNQANYTYGNGYPKVTVHNCENSIEYVYGGGNAAAVAATDVTIWGGNKIGNVFGGGNGQVSAANVNGNTSVKIYGGTIGDVYGGSNTNGTIGGTISVNVNAQKEESAEYACPIYIDNVYGGGNKAASAVGNVTIGCAEHIGAVYGGANQANVTGNITLNINSGHIDNVFGGNNNSGNISGTITVNVNDNGSICGMEIGNVYGGGNKAAYGSGANYPVVNILNGTLTGSVFGGGLGETAVVTGNPQVTIGQATGTVTIAGDVYGGGDAGNVAGTPVVKIFNNCNNTMANVYGGGNAADVTGTNVTVDGGTIGMVFGGGHGDKDANPQKEANVNGNVALTITGGTIDKVFAGSNSKGNITGTANLTVNKGTGSCDLHITELYGGGNEAAGNAGTITIQNTGTASEGIGTVYGGANNADINSNITLNITGGNIGDLFGGNNNGGQVKGDIKVNVNWSGTGVNHVGNVYGGGNIASIDNGTPREVTVNITNATVSGSVFGGGKGKEAVIVGNPTVNIGSWTTGRVEISGNVFGGGDLAAVEGATKVIIRDCDTYIGGDLYGGGNAAPVYETNTTMWGGTVAGNLFGGGNGVNLNPETGNPNGAQVGYKRNDTETAGTGNANTNLYGGTVGNWNGSTCESGGGVFGGSNSNGNIRGYINLTVEEKPDGDNHCPLTFKEIYGAGNEAAYNGEGINFNLGCVSELGEIYGGAKSADLNKDAILTITSGHFKKVFGGNNVSGKLNGKIVVNIDETGCNPVIIDELYGGGNLAPYSVFGYNDDGRVMTSGTAQPDPVINIISCTHIGTVYGGGYGESAVMVGNPTVNINQIKGIHAGTTHNDVAIPDTLGEIETVFGGGNAAKVIGNTNVNVGTLAQNAHIQNEDGNIDTTPSAAGANITGNIYGGGNQADVTGKTNVTIGR